MINPESTLSAQTPSQTSLPSTSTSPPAALPAEASANPAQPPANQTLTCCVKETPSPEAPAAASSLPKLFANEDPAAHALAPVQPPNASPAEEPLLHLQFINPAVGALQKPPAAKPRNGKIARLPKLYREMVNRMLANNVPHQKIVGALSECGFQATHRNISNWKTRGGYSEWCAAQARALELRNFQDNLADFLRRHDAAELSEVGLQSAATNLSAVLLRPDLMRELLSDPAKYSKLIDLQCRLARELHALQKDRDAISKIVGGNPERHKREAEKEVELTREAYSYAVPPKSIRDEGVQHHNFIPKELEPVFPLRQNTLAEMLTTARKPTLAQSLPNDKREASST